jgi:hypothetical protein
MNNQMSLFVPHVFAKITKEKIASIFLRFGEIDRIDLVPKKTGDKQPHNAAYIRYKRWYDTEENREFQQRLTGGAMKAHLTYHDKWFWIVLENKRVEKPLPPTPMPSPISSPATPPRRNSPIIVPGAPKKPPKKKFNSLNQIARLHTESEDDKEKHIAQDLFGDDTCDLVDATYVYHMECEVRRLTELNMQLSYALMIRNIY